MVVVFHEKEEFSKFTLKYYHVIGTLKAHRFEEIRLCPLIKDLLYNLVQPCTSLITTFKLAPENTLNIISGDDIGYVFAVFSGSSLNVVIRDVHGCTRLRSAHCVSLSREKEVT